jgi:hypothetical protein
MAKAVISRNFRYPSAELRDRVRLAVKEQGFRSEQKHSSLLPVSANFGRANSEATAQLEARIAAKTVRR